MLEEGEVRAGWTLAVGPGRRLAGLAPLLERLAPARADGPGRVEALGELGELLRHEPSRSRLILDADELPLEDLGFLRRALAQQVGLDLVLVGEDPGRRSARRLLREGGARWLAWPLDLEELESLLGPPRGRAAEPRSAPPPASPSAGERRDESPGAGARAEELDPTATLAAIRAVLEEPPAGLPAAGDGPAWVELEERAEEPPLEELLGDEELAESAEFDEGEELERELARDLDLALAEDVELERALAGAFDEEATVEEEHSRAAREGQADDPFAAEERAPDAAEDPEPGSPTVLVPRPAAPPPWFRRQVADLADLAQRLDLALEDLRAEGADGDEGLPLASLEGEVARLVQFTRTLGFLVAPPPRGNQRIELGGLVEELAQGLVHARADGPRCLLRRRGDTTVRSDKTLLVTALDAFLVLAARCAEAGDVLRLQCAALEPEGLVRLTLDFPEGPLASQEPERWIEPYALRESLPEIGPNALRAALAIVSGQGGRASLARSRPGRLAWTIDLPAAGA